MTATARFYEHSYSTAAFAAQRRFPNEELCRFMGRHFFSLGPTERAATRILEVGCGSGANLWMIAREGFDAHGLELAAAALPLCEQMLAGYGCAATLMQGDMTQLPYDDGYFDAIVDVFSSNCLDLANFGRYLGEVARILKPGGRWFCYTPGQGSDAWRNPAPSRLIDAHTLDGIKRTTSPFTGNDYPFRFETRGHLHEAMRRVGLAGTIESVTRTYRDGAEMFEFLVVDAQRI